VYPDHIVELFVETDDLVKASVEKGKNNIRELLTDYENSPKSGWTKEMLDKVKAVIS